MRRNMSVKSNKDWFGDFKENFEIRYEQEAKWGSPW